jgi:hypothetical protein
MRPSAVDGRIVSDERGAAMLEFVLMLPFIWLVLVLLFDFGQAFLERQRTLVAAREVAIRYNAQVDASGDTSYGAIRGQVARDTLGVRNLTGVFGDSDSDNCPGHNDGISLGPIGGALHSGMSGLDAVMGGFLGAISSTTVHEVSAQGRPVAGALFLKPSYSACVAIDSGSWTSSQVGGLLGIVKALVKGAGNLIGSLF